MEGNIKVKRWRLYVFVTLLMTIPLRAPAEAPEEYRVKDSDLTVSAAEANLTEIEQALGDFRKLCEILFSDEIMEKLKQSGDAMIDLRAKRTEIRELKSIDWSVQQIGFPNWILVIRGTMLRLDYLIKKSELDSRGCKDATTGEELERLRTAAQEALKKYRSFLRDSVFVD